MKRVRAAIAAICVFTGLSAGATPTLDQMVNRAQAHLANRQEAGGGWSSDLGGLKLPAITGLVVTGFLLDPNIGPDDPAVAAGLRFILEHQQPDGGIYDRVLPSYNTAICVSALSLARDESDGKDRERYSRAVEAGVGFLRGLQWGESAIDGTIAGDTAESVTRDHPFYGGVGYGRSGRPDNSNLALWLQALEDAGVPGDDPAVQRALAFLERTQMLDDVNDMAYADGSAQGGFIYATSPSSEELGIGESKAGEIVETTDDGTRVSRLRAYGSMTYAGFKAYTYADLDPNDPRVLAAREWIGANYTLEENPGIGDDGRYYFYMVFGRALGAIGRPTIDTDSGERAWADDLVAALAELQTPTGEFEPVNDRWMEDNPELIGAYALIALENARAHTTPTETEEPD